MTSKIHKTITTQSMVRRLYFMIHRSVLFNSQDPNSQNGQNQRLGELAASLQARSVELKINFSQTLHDREIRFVQN